MAAPVPLTPPVDMPAVDEADEDDVDEDQVDEDLQRVLRRLEQEGEQDGDCRLWPEAGCNDQSYPKVALGNRSDGNRRVVTVYKWLWEREQGAGTPRLEPGARVSYTGEGAQ
ncbi:MAG: hypothetical protein M3069_32290 [Chloroflexota bacterium]|nr:hypothetical protein [Chloroflexota bacterium]